MSKFSQHGIGPKPAELMKFSKQLGEEPYQARLLRDSMSQEHLRKESKFSFSKQLREEPYQARLLRDSMSQEQLHKESKLVKFSKKLGEESVQSEEEEIVLEADEENEDLDEENIKNERMRRSEHFDTNARRDFGGGERRKKEKSVPFVQSLLRDLMSKEQLPKEVMPQNESTWKGPEEIMIVKVKKQEDFLKDAIAQKSHRGSLLQWKLPSFRDLIYKDDDQSFLTPQTTTSDLSEDSSPSTPPSMSSIHNTDTSKKKESKEFLDILRKFQAKNAESRTALKDFLGVREEPKRRPSIRHPSLYVLDL
jgi:hypothetical protein